MHSISARPRNSLVFPFKDGLSVNSVQAAKQGRLRISGLVIMNEMRQEENVREEETPRRESTNGDKKLTSVAAERETRF